MSNKTIMQEKPWKKFQLIYNSVITEHTDSLSRIKVIEDYVDIVDNAVRYVMSKEDVAIYPAKSYIVAIIYATMLNKIYGVDFYDALDDGDLFLGQDRYFVPYSSDTIHYDLILKRLESIPGWIDSGWCPQTVRYFHAECTQSGLNQAIRNFYDTGVAVDN